MPPFSVALAAVILACSVAATQAQSLAITIDDGPHIKTTPLLSPKQRNDALLATLAKHKVKAALFVTVGNGANTAQGYAFARAWGEAGHAVGNHTMTHPNLHSAAVTLAQYQQEVLDCDAVIKTIPGYQKWLRFTFLREGNTPEKRDGMRTFLATLGYRNAHVTIDTSDWRLEEKLIAVLSKDIKADIAPIKQVYLDHMRQRALAYRALAQRVQGRDIAHVLLIHHNLINALWLDDVIAQYKQMGWTITPPEVALQDPVYALNPVNAAAGQSLLLSMARSLGLDRFEGWARLVDDGEADIDALKVQGI